MPEGPEVRITAENLRDEMRNNSIGDIVVTKASRYYSSGIPNKDSIAFPLFVTDVRPKGKKIIIECNDANWGQVILINSLGMEGKWRHSGGKHAGIELHLEEKVMYFHDTRHFGSFHVCFTNEEVDFVLKDVGPDLLNEDVDFSDYEEVISRKNIRNMEICAFLMNQKYFSGVGNYVMAEVLYECGILPTRKLKDLSDSDRYNLWEKSIEILKSSYYAGGLTIATYSNIHGEKGVFEVKCYGRKADDYGNPICSGTFSNGRTSWYCPAVQF